MIYGIGVYEKPPGVGIEMIENDAIIDYLLQAVKSNGKPKKVLKNKKARSISYIAEMGKPNFESKQIVSLMLKAMRAGIIQFVKSEPRLEWNENDFPVLLVPVDNAKKVLSELHQAK